MRSAFLCFIRAGQDQAMPTRFLTSIARDINQVYFSSNSLVPPSTMTAAASRRTYPSSTSQDVSASLAPCSPCDVGSRLWDLTDKSTIHGWLSHHFLHRLAVGRSHSQTLRLNLPDATKAGRTAARIRCQRSCKSLAQNLSSRARNLTSPGKPS